MKEMPDTQDQMSCSDAAVEALAPAEGENDAVPAGGIRLALKTGSSTRTPLPGAAT
jgi:hypothetical protein